MVQVEVLLVILVQMVLLLLLICRVSNGLGRMKLHSPALSIVLFIFYFDISFKL